MASEFLKSTKELDDAISQCTSPEEIREVTKQQLVREGKIQRDAESQGQGCRFLPGQRTEPTGQVVPENWVPTDAEGHELLSRVVTVGNQSHLLTAYSTSGLDVLEKGWRKNRT